MMRPLPESPVAEIRELTVRFGRLTAVEGVSLAVAEGSVYALLGRNGAGKTSLVRCLLGHRRPAAGAARLFGRDVWAHRARLLARVGVVPESADAPPAMTAARLGRFSARLYPAWDAAAYAGRLARLRLPGGMPFGRLSKGQRNQVMLSLALACRPRLLVLDDPTLGLDAVARRSVFDELIDELAGRGTTVFLTTHDLAGVEGIADRVGILEAGRLVLDERLDTLRSRFRRLEFPHADAVRLGGSAALQRLAPLTVAGRSWGVEAVVERFDAAALAAVERGPGAAEVAAAPLTLEEIFVAVTGGGGGSGS